MRNRDIECFLAVANTLSFTRAAKLLYVSQQSVTKRIAGLERELGVALFERDTHKVSLTEAGKIAKIEMEDLNLREFTAMQKVQSAGDADSKRISLGFYTEAPRDELVEPIMRHLKHRFTGVSFTAELYHFDVLRTKLIEGSVDFAVTLAWDREYWPDVDAVVLKHYPPRIFVTANHPWARKKTLTQEDLKTETLLTHMPGISISHNTPFERVKAARYVFLPNFSSILANLPLGGFAMTTELFDGWDSGKYVYFPFPEDVGDFHCELIFAYSRRNNNSELPIFTRCISEGVPGLEI